MLYLASARMPRRKRFMPHRDTTPEFRASLRGAAWHRFPPPSAVTLPTHTHFRASL